jgi:hypothetical protein
LAQQGSQRLLVLKHTTITEGRQVTDA